MMMTCFIAALLICCMCMSRRPLATLMFSIPAACLFFFASFDADHYMVMLLSPGLFLVPYIYVGFFLAAEEHVVAHMAARRVLIAIFLLLLVLLTGFLFGPLVMAGILAFLVWMAAMIAYGSTARHSLLFSVLSTLKASMTQNLPLPMALDCASQGRTDQEGAVYRELKTHLVKGHSLVEAFSLALPQSPGHITGVLQGAERMGCLTSGLAAVHKNVALRDKRKQACEPVHPAYPVIVLVLMAFITSALFKFVIPQFMTVIREISGDDLPFATQWLAWVWTDLSGPIIWGFGIVFGLWSIITIIGWLNRGQRPVWIMSITDWIRWHLPFIHKFDRMFALIQVLETLNLGLNAGTPVDQAVSQCKNLNINRCFVRRIRKWHRLIEQGESVSKAALASRLPRALAWAFDTNVNQGNTPSILSMLEETYSDRYVYHSNLLGTILAPCITMILAAMVCFVMVAIFMPMVSTITSLTGIYP